MKRSLGLAGWRFEGDLPPEKKYVALAAPHTSNWDGLMLVLLGQSIGLQFEWMIKDSWVKGPLGPAIRRLGAIGIDRSRSTNLVDQMIERFAQRDEFILAIPPEGTRSRAEYWKSGFYQCLWRSCAGGPRLPRLRPQVRRPRSCDHDDGRRARRHDEDPSLLRRAEADRVRSFELRSDSATRRGPRQEAVKPLRPDARRVADGLMVASAMRTAPRLRRRASGASPDRQRHATEDGGAGEDEPRRRVLPEEYDRGGGGEDGDEQLEDRGAGRREVPERRIPNAVAHTRRDRPRQGRQKNAARRGLEARHEHSEQEQRDEGQRSCEAR